jgi:hypothetical protein
MITNGSYKSPCLKNTFIMYYNNTNIGEPRDVRAFLKCMSHFSMCGLFIKIIFLTIICGVELKTAKTIENMIHDEVIKANINIIRNN